MTTLVLGGSGATGLLLVDQLLKQEHKVKIIVRRENALPGHIRNHKNISIVEASLLDLSDKELKQQALGCNAVASCLGHNLSLKGIYGAPRSLVAEATRRLCKAIKSNTPDSPIKYVLMNTAGNSNRDLYEPITFTEKMVIGLLRLVLPPHIDNEMAADYLRIQIGQADNTVEWAVVRPDTLINEDRVTQYKVFPSPITSAIFKPGKTSRINVAHFMVRLISNDDTWQKWKGQMPVIYNKSNK